ncbi:hypothetical protein BKA69DRAFT_1127535 [Paraphysoderma sedebokerense]|nr:hypothetical protein BKA69DRAFT_1127535 [Paraphysoderma sedebokerense]
MLGTTSNPKESSSFPVAPFLPKVSRTVVGVASSAKPPVKEFWLFEECSLSLSDLLDCPSFSDITVKFSGEEYELHKCILYSQSEFFRGLLDENNSWSAKGSVVELKETDQLCEFGLLTAIEYLYGVKKIDHYTFSDLIRIFTAAHYLGIPTLAHACMSAIIKKLDKSNVLPLLSFVYDHNFGNIGDNIGRSVLSWLSHHAYSHQLEGLIAQLPDELAKPVLDAHLRLE